MARILVVEPDPSARELIVELLEELNHDAVGAEDADDALSWAGVGGMDLLLMAARLPGEDPKPHPDLCRLLAPPRGLCVYVANAADADTLRAELTASEDVLLKPLDLARVSEAVARMLESGGREEGRFGDGSLDALLARVENDAESGVLTCFWGSLTKTVVFVEGELALCSSNDPAELLGQFLVGAGLLTEEQLLEAIARQEASGEAIGRVVQAVASLPEALLESTVRDKQVESLLDLFLWVEGSWIYRPGALPGARHPGIAISLAPLRAEAAYRLETWPSMLAHLPADSACFEVSTEAAPRDLEPLERRIVELGRASRTLGEMRLALRASHYRMARALTGLLAEGTLKVREARPAAESGAVTVRPSRPHRSSRVPADERGSGSLVPTPVETPAPAGLATPIAPAIIPPGALRSGAPEGNPTPVSGIRIPPISALRSPPSGSQRPTPVAPRPDGGDWEDFERALAAPTDPPLDGGTPSKNPTPVAPPAVVVWGEGGDGRRPTPIPPHDPGPRLGRRSREAKETPPVPIDRAQLDALRPSRPTPVEEKPQEDGPRTPMLPAEPEVPTLIALLGRGTPSRPMKISDADLPRPVSRRRDVRMLIAAAREAAETGDAHAARLTLEDALRVDPCSAEARRALSELDRSAVAEASARGLHKDQTIRLAIPLRELTKLPLQPTEAFILSRLGADAMPAGDLVLLCPVPEAEVLAVLERYLEGGVVEIVFDPHG